MKVFAALVGIGMIGFGMSMVFGNVAIMVAFFVQVMILAASWPKQSK